jgi:hypothetical protein
MGYGTKAGGIAARDTNIKLYGKDYYARIGAEGGRNGNTGGFGQGEAGRARARKYGILGGRKSRRTATKKIES